MKWWGTPECIVKQLGSVQRIMGHEDQTVYQYWTEGGFYYESFSLQLEIQTDDK